MFKNAIDNLPLTDELASELFTNINADAFDGDSTFCATLRFLLFEKLQPLESVSVRLLIDKSSGGDFCIPYALDNDTLYIYVSKGSAAGHLDRTHISAHIHNFDMYTYQDQASLYLTQAGCESHVYINESTRTTIVFTLNMTMKLWHKMQSSITRLLPWHFSGPIDESERAFLHSLTKKDSSEYLRYITDYANKFNFHEDRLKRLLKDFGLSYEKKRLEVLQKERAANLEDYNRAQEEIKKCVSMDREIQIAILGIEALLEKGDGTGLADYFICYKCLHLVGVQNEELSYIVTTYLEYFDQAVFEKYMKNPKSYFFDNHDGIAHDHVGYKKLLYALFGDDPIIKLRVCAEFKMSLSGTLDGVSSSPLLANYPDWLPHPHIDSTHCLGTNAHYINEMMLAKKYIEAIEQTIAATKNMNFADAVVAKKLVTKLKTSKQRFIELPTGEVVAPAEAVSWIKEREVC